MVTGEQSIPVRVPIELQLKSIDVVLAMIDQEIQSGSDLTADLADQFGEEAVAGALERIKLRLGRKR